MSYRVYPAGFWSPFAVPCLWGDLMSMTLQIQLILKYLSARKKEKSPSHTHTRLYEINPTSMETLETIKNKKTASLLFEPTKSTCFTQCDLTDQHKTTPFTSLVNLQDHTIMLQWRTLSWYWWKISQPVILSCKYRQCFTSWASSD